MEEMYVSFLQVCGLSNVGLHRKENQDAFMINSLVDKGYVELTIDTEGHAFSKNGLSCAIADGMGGLKGGATASLSVLEMLSLKVTGMSGKNEKDANDYLLGGINEINEKLLEKSKNNTDLYGMGTTLVGLHITPEYTLCFHVGDSRLYRLRAGTLMQLTSDHSLENSMSPPDHNRILLEKTGIITNYLGGGSNECRPEIRSISFHDDDLLILCSDGLSDMLDVEAIESILNMGKPLNLKASTLIKEANESGGKDNITLVLVDKRHDINRE
jgi:PPM family protein phosphatase